MEIKEKILDFMYRLETIPIGHESLLKEYLSDLRKTIQQTFSSDSPYLNYLQFIKFKPDTVFVTDREREQSWQNGATQVDNLLRVLLNDPKVNVQNPSPTSLENAAQQSLSDFNQSVIENQQKIQKSILESQTEYVIAHEDADAEIFPSEKMKDAVSQSLENLQQSIIAEHPDMKNHVLPESVQVQNENKQQAIPGLQKVLLVPSQDEHLNAEVSDFLCNLQIEALSIPKGTEQETVMDRMNRCLEADFVVFVLSADFHIYARSLTAADSSLAASQVAAFQLGYFAGKFDRKNMVVLYREETEFVMPTEFFDLFYIPVTASGNWKEDVLRRMKGKQELSESLGLSKENNEMVS
ncbi:MAG: nucleotide-binding protein [Candidatus Omnitrophica bacterium]|nr:nucleotide-binding protein [Candidatus Omnitrophota bacterium]